MKNRGCFIVLFLSLFFSTQAQYKLKERSGSRPEWINKAPTGKQYKYFVGVGGSDHSLSDAKEIAMTDIISQLSREEGIKINAAEKLSLTKSIGERYQDGETNSNRDQQLTKESNISIKAQEVFLEKLEVYENYWQKSEDGDKVIYEYFLLARIVKKNRNKKDEYGFRPVWRSALIPGWGQLYKRQKLRSVLYFASFAASTSYIIYTQTEVNYHNDRLSDLRNGKINVSNLDEVISDNEDDLDFWKTRRNIAIGATAGIYIWNIIDAATSKGKTFYAFNEKNKRNWELTAYGSGIRFNLRF